MDGGLLVCLYCDDERPRILKKEAISIKGRTGGSIGLYSDFLNNKINSI